MNISQLKDQIFIHKCKIYKLDFILKKKKYVNLNFKLEY